DHWTSLASTWSGRIPADIWDRQTDKSQLLRFWVIGQGAELHHLSADAWDNLSRQIRKGNVSVTLPDGSLLMRQYGEICW
ncbi:hypothetical protein NL351_30330, partial [Klebsiella pneumoniae]|nr:hypothetical protein [Klebsiella pneumoniae]